MLLGNVVGPRLVEDMVSRRSFLEHFQGHPRLTNKNCQTQILRDPFGMVLLNPRPGQNCPETSEESTQASDLPLDFGDARPSPEPPPEKADQEWV